jgi:quercetin dioxygenase-like cupin family protein
MTRLIGTDLTGLCEDKVVTIDLLEAAPGTSGKHYHPGHSFTWIVDGSEIYAIEGRKPPVIHSGDLLHEEPMQVHTTENDLPVKLLVMRILEKANRIPCTYNSYPGA